MKNSIFCSLLAASSFLLAPQLLFSDVLIPVSASTDMGSGFGTMLENTFNGTGLTEFPSLTASHFPSDPLNSWVSDSTVSGQIDFDLGGIFSVDGFSFWNQNGGGPGLDGSTGIQDVVVQASTNGLDFFDVSGAPAVFAQVTGMDLELPEQFSFDPVNATHIRFVVQSNYGDLQTGFGEVAFSSGSATVPEPANLVLATLAGFAMMLRRSKRGRA